MRQPYKSKRDGPEWTLACGEVGRQRPELVSLIGECVAIWPHIEHDLALALNFLLGLNGAPSAAVFAALKGFRSQKEMIEAAASAVLDEECGDLVSACLSAAWTAQRARDDIAHGVWGVAEAHTDRLIWVSGQDWAVWTSKFLNAHNRRDMLQEIERAFFIYKREDLISVRDMLLRMRIVTHNMSLFCHTRTAGPERAALSKPLLDEPLVRQALDRLIATKNKK